MSAFGNLSGLGATPIQDHAEKVGLYLRSFKDEVSKFSRARDTEQKALAAMRAFMLYGAVQEEYIYSDYEEKYAPAMQDLGKMLIPIKKWMARK